MTKEQIMQKIIKKQDELIKWLVKYANPHSIRFNNYCDQINELKQQLMECEGENITKDEFGYNDTEIPEKANNQTEIRECQYCPYNITGTTVGWYCKECGIKLGIT